MARNSRRGPTPAASIDDWLNLVDPDGAFVTPGQLRAVFPHGFDPMPGDQRADLRAQVADATTDPGTRSALRQWLLATVLEWGDQLVEGQQLPVTSLVRAAEHGVHLRPDQALLDVDNANLVRLAVFVWPNGTRLDRRPDVAVAGDTWPASPVQRAETWCRESGVPLALVTDDDQWVLVWAPRGAPAASCRWRISDLADERILQAGFISLLGARRFFAVQTDETLEALFRSAADAEAEITKGLGLSVRRSVELLVAAISRDDVAHDGIVLRGVPATEVYEASVTVMMRLVFLLFAEERRLLPAEDPLWAESYSVLTLRDDLRISAVRDGEDALERRSSAWHRLLATFRAVHGGVNHDRLTLPAYGGSLFDPDRFPFLEGRRAPDHLIVSGVDLGPADDAVEGPGRPVAIDDRTVLAILDALLTIEVKSGRTKVAQRVSYKALDVEQIGHCYEGLLDHGASPIDVLALGLVGPDGAEPEIWIEDLETQLALGQDMLCDWLSDKDRCGKSASALAGLLTKQPEGVDLARLRIACGHDDETVTRVLPFWGLIRTDLRGLPIVLLPGSQYVTQTSTRRNMGAQYTTKALAEEVVRYALEPLVYDPGPQNEADPGKWQLRTPAQILDLRVCDPAVGSGAILTAAGRYLADRLIESVTRYGSGEGTFAERLADLAAAPAGEQIVLARREIVDHCLYGVDKNSVAAEMAKLSLWLTTTARERPFTFLDHAIQVGDSLLGITDMEQLRWLHLDPSQRKGVGGFETLALDERIKEASDLSRRLQERSVVTTRDAAEKRRLHDELKGKLRDLAIVGDAVVGAALTTAGKSGVTMEERLGAQQLRVRTLLDNASSDLERTAAFAALQGTSTAWLRVDLPDETPLHSDRQCLHWPLAFPDVFLRDGRQGFDVVVSNPPYMGAKYWKKRLGARFHRFFSELLTMNLGKPDIVAVFMWRFKYLVADGGTIGALATQSLSEVDSKAIMINRVLDELTIFRAIPALRWPGAANVLVSIYWIIHGSWNGNRLLDTKIVAAISADLTPQSNIDPIRLKRSAFVSFDGVNNAKGQVFVVEAADPIIDVGGSLFRPYVSGEDLSLADPRTPERYVLDLTGFSANGLTTLSSPIRAFINDVIRPARSAETLASLPGLVNKWWMFWRTRELDFRRLRLRDTALALPAISKHLIALRVPAEWTFTNKVVLVEDSRPDSHVLLLSSTFEAWARRYGGTMGGGLVLKIGAVMETFPLPTKVSEPLLAEEWQSLVYGALEEHGPGLTDVLNAVYDPENSDGLINEIRECKRRLDLQVVRSYGWTDFVSAVGAGEQIAGRILDRLLELNHQRYAEEVAAGLHDKKSKKAPAKRARTVDKNQESLL